MIIDEWEQLANEMAAVHPLNHQIIAAQCDVLQRAAEG